MSGLKFSLVNLVLFIFYLKIVELILFSIYEIEFCFRMYQRCNLCYAKSPFNFLKSTIFKLNWLCVCLTNLLKNFGLTIVIWNTNSFFLKEWLKSNICWTYLVLQFKIKRVLEWIWGLWSLYYTQYMCTVRETSSVFNDTCLHFSWVC